MALFDEVTGRFLCECGCGEEVVDPLSEYKTSHHMRSAEHRERQSNLAFEQNIGTVKGPYSKEYCKAISRGQLKSYREDPTRAGRVSEALLGLVRSDEQIEANRKAHNELYASEEGEALKDRLSEAKLGKIMSDEFRAKRSEIMLKMWEDPVYRESMSGENSPNWEVFKGGLSGSYGYGWSALSEYIKIRDNHTCQGCGWKGASFGDTVAHHIDGVFYNCGERNLITVCYSCNGKARHNEEYWIEYYSNKVKEIYGDEILSTQGGGTNVA